MQPDPSARSCRGGSAGCGCRSGRAGRPAPPSRPSAAKASASPARSAAVRAGPAAPTQSRLAVARHHHAHRQEGIAGAAWAEVRIARSGPGWKAASTMQAHARGADGQHRIARPRRPGPQGRAHVVARPRRDRQAGPHAPARSKLGPQPPAACQAAQAAAGAPGPSRPARKAPASHAPVAAVQQLRAARIGRVRVATSPVSARRT